MPPEHDDTASASSPPFAAISPTSTSPPAQRCARPSRSGGARLAWLLVTLVLMGVSLAGGVAIGGNRDAVRDPASSSGVTTSSVAASSTASPECAEAVERANRTISHAVLVSAALREHTEAMNKLRDGRPDPEAAVKAGTPSLIAGSAESAKFDVALADYRKVVDRCQLQTP